MTSPWEILALGLSPWGFALTAPVLPSTQSQWVHPTFPQQGRAQPCAFPLGQGREKCSCSKAEVYLGLCCCHLLLKNHPWKRGGGDAFPSQAWAGILQPFLLLSHSFLALICPDGDC